MLSFLLWSYLSIDGYGIETGFSLVSPATKNNAIEKKSLLNWA